MEKLTEEIDSPEKFTEKRLKKLQKVDKLTTPWKNLQKK